MPALAPGSSSTIATKMDAWAHMYAVLARIGGDARKISAVRASGNCPLGVAKPRPRVAS